MLRMLVAGGLLGFAAVAGSVGMQPTEASKAAASHTAGKHTSPTWAQLNAEQREALSPLAGDWDKFDDTRKKKWLDIAVHYKNLSPDGQQRMHERMPDLAKLTPEQRTRARENFKKAYALPPEQRRTLTQQFQDLPEEKKRELAELSKKKPDPPPRRPAAAPKAAAAHPGAAKVDSNPDGANPAPVAAGSGAGAGH
ncbi:putative Membrane protein [Burkholderiales bacterium]|nr:putative Membrane protein [Burkholderiales bacterium]